MSNNPHAQTVKIAAIVKSRAYRAGVADFANGRPYATDRWAGKGAAGGFCAMHIYETGRLAAAFVGTEATTVGGYARAAAARAWPEAV